MSKILIFAGVLLVLMGLFWPFLMKGPWGRLPGDITIKREHITLYFPIATSLVVSILISLFLWLIRKR